MKRFIVNPGEVLRPVKNVYIAVRLEDYANLRRLIDGISQDHDLDGIDDYLDELFGYINLDIEE